MLNSLSLKNFKAFKKLENLNIKPLTILCGPNSSGKSSILQSLLLTKQTLDSQNTNHTLLLNERFVHLGNFQNIIYDKNPDNLVSFEFEFSFTKQNLYDAELRTSVPISYLLMDLYEEDIANLGNVEYYIKFLVTILADKEIGTSSLKIIIPTLIKNIEYEVGIKNISNLGNIGKKEYNPTKFKFTHFRGDLYSVVWEAFLNRITDKNKKYKKGNGEVRITFSNFIPKTVNLSKREKKDSGLLDLAFFRFFNSSNELMLSLFKAFSYIGPLRVEPSRRYIYEDEVLEIGNKGENAAYIYWTESDKTIESSYFFRDGKFNKQANILLKDAVDEWLNLMGIKDFNARLSNEKIIYLDLFSNTTESTTANIADVGFGVSQLFPIILEGIRCPKGNTFLLEQPEIHLHPKVQMQLADFFLSLALSGKKVIVETHSDHIINRLVHRIVEDKQYKLKDLIGIYFIETTENGSKYEEIVVDEMYGIKNWPKGFFDQTADEQAEILRKGIMKRKGKL